MTKRKTQDDLTAEFRRIKKDHAVALQRRMARIVLGASVVRVFARGTKAPLMKTLCRLDVDALKRLKTQAAFRQWFTKALNRVARTVRQTNAKNARIMPGYKWGHSTKVLALYVRDLVLHTRYFTDRQVALISPWLYVPIDGVIMDRCRALGLDPGVRQIKAIDTAARFFRLQDLLTDPAAKAGVPRVWFDDAWGDRR